MNAVWSACRALWFTIGQVPATMLILAVRCYQWTISPLLGRCCRFEPTCSVYFIEAVKKHGTLRGSLMGIKRVLRCHPWSHGGYDPP